MNIKTKLTRGLNALRVFLVRRRLAILWLIIILHQCTYTAPNGKKYSGECAYYEDVFFNMVHPIKVLSSIDSTWEGTAIILQDAENKRIFMYGSCMLTKSLAHDYKDGDILKIGITIAK